MNILQQIQNNADLRRVKPEDIPQLCQEIRSFLVEKVSKTGGHLASNLGAVELTVALHRVYDPFTDRILFDVGHQSYVHKMLTGRLNDFDSLRQMGGISGFPIPRESPADPFIAGHASEAVSLAMGMARARTVRGEDYDVVAVVGDGAMTGGLCYEALSDAGTSREPVVIVLNDNGMSINKNVGGIARLLSRARMRPAYFRFKKVYRRVMKNHPGLYSFFHRMKEGIKRRLLPQGIFDDLGLYYLGPVDGHDEPALEAAIRWAKEQRVPVLIHVVTVKGKGYEPAETAPEKYHGVDKFDPCIGVNCQPKEDYSARFGAALTRLAEKDSTVFAVTAAMESGTGLEGFAARFPDRFLELGIVEEHAAAMCAGMASQGLKPVFAVYSSFLQRAYDMLIEDVGLLGVHAVFAVDRAGLVGRDGITHQGSFDVAYLSSVPGMTIYAPSSYAELDSMLEKALFRDTGPVAVRYPRGCQGRYTGDLSAENTSVMARGRDVTLVFHGVMADPVLTAAETLSAEGIGAQIIKVNRILPLDAEPILSSLKETGCLVSVEDACRFGSVGSAVLERTAAEGLKLSGVRQLDLGAGVIPHGAVEQLHRQLGLDAEGIVNAVREVIREKDPT